MSINNLKLNKISKLLFWSSVILVIISGVFPNLYWLNGLCKPLLMPFLALYFISFKSIKGYKAVLIALLFSWLGDLLLMFQQKHELFFIAGLVSFLMAHIAYIIAFSMSIKSYQISNKKILIITLIICYELLFLYFLYPTLNELLVPVILYATVICTMLVFALLRFPHVSMYSFTITFLGALLFVLSDSTIAVNKFLMPFTLAYPVIIALYATGQYLIINGLVSKNRFKKAYT